MYKCTLILVMKVTNRSLLNQDKRFSNESPLFPQPADVRHKCSVIMCLLPSPVIAADSRCQVVAVEIFKCMKIFNNDGAPPSSQPPGQTRC